MIRRIGALLLVCTFLGVAPAAHAQPQPETEKKSPEELMTEGAKMLMEAMRLFLQSVPQFGEPYINDNGDIVIPRLHPEQEDPAPKEDPSDNSDTRRI